MLPWLGVDRELQGSGIGQGAAAPTDLPFLGYTGSSPTFCVKNKSRSPWRDQAEAGGLEGTGGQRTLTTLDKVVGTEAWGQGAGGVRCSTGLPLPPQQAGRDSQVPLLLLSTFLPWCSR